MAFVKSRHIVNRMIAPIMDDLNSLSLLLILILDGLRNVGYPAIQPGGAVGAIALGCKDDELIVAVHECIRRFVRTGQLVRKAMAFVVSHGHTRLLP